MLLSATINFYCYSGAKDCASAKCGQHAGCKRVREGNWICVCPNDLKIPQPDGSCSRSVGTGGAPASRKKFITIQRSDKTNYTSAINTNNEAVPKTISDSSDKVQSMVTWIVPLVGLILLVVLVASIWIRRKQRTKTTDPETNSSIQMPVCLSKNVILQERLTSNPEYWASNLSTATLDCDGNGRFKSFIIINPEWIELDREIGEGCFGKVFKGQLRFPDGITGNVNSNIIEDVAVKVLKAGADSQAQEDLLREAEIMRSFHHCNILSLRGIVINESRIGTWMVVEYMALGDLAQLLRASNGNRFTKEKSPYHFKEEDLHSIALQIANGMVYLSSQRFVHRDLACRNCLVGQNLTVKISDFGMSRDVYTCDYYKIGGSRMLPVRWMSPESIMYGKFTLESDIWSFGVVLWEIYALGRQPYYGHSNEQVLKLILRGILLTPPEGASLFIRQLMSECWKSLPSQRTPFSEIYTKLANHRPQTTITYAEIRHTNEDRFNRENSWQAIKTPYLQPLPDLPLHIYSNTIAQK